MRSITVKLTMAFLLIGLTGAVLVAVILQLRTRSAFTQFVVNRDQQSFTDTLVGYYTANGNWNGINDYLQSLFNSNSQAGFTVSNQNGEWHSSFRGWPAPFTLVATNGTVLIGDGQNRVGTEIPASDLGKAVPLISNGKTIGWLLQPGPVRIRAVGAPENLFLQSVNQATLVAGGVAVLLALLLGGLLAFTQTRSLRELTEATEEIARGKYGRQVKIRSKDELGDLATSFNKMSLDLVKAIESRKQMTADIAHDLRTPLSVISGYSEALADGKLPGTPDIYNVMYQESQHLSRLIEDLRVLSLADAGELPLSLLEVQPATFLERAAIRHGVSAEQTGVTIRAASDGEVPAVRMDPERMAQVLDNLICNALRYTPRGGSILLKAQAVDGQVQMQVQDTGSGIAPEDLPYVFDRFYRGDPARQQSGESGLGLAIGKSIVEAHGGKLTVASQPGSGATFTISLPLGSKL